MQPSFSLASSRLSTFPLSDEKFKTRKKKTSRKSVTRKCIVLQMFLIFLPSPWVNIILWIEWKMSQIYSLYLTSFFFFFFLSGRGHKKTRREKRWHLPCTFSEGRRNQHWDWFSCRKEGCILLLFPTKRQRTSCYRFPQVFQSRVDKMSLPIFSPIQILRDFGCGKSASTVQKFKAWLALWFWMWVLPKNMYFGKDTSLLFLLQEQSCNMFIIWYCNDN